MHLAIKRLLVTFEKSETGDWFDQKIDFKGLKY